MAVYGVYEAQALDVPSYSDLEFNDSMLKELRGARADEWEISGRTVILRGSIRIPFRDLVLYADRATVDLENQDLELFGNIRLYKVKEASSTVSIKELIKLSEGTGVDYHVLGYTRSPLGEQAIKVKVSYESDALRSASMTGNLESGTFSFTDAVVDYNNFVLKAGKGIRHADGTLEAEDVAVSNCSFLTTDQGHYSFNCAKAKIVPHQTGLVGAENIDPDMGEYSIFAYNCFVNIYGVPVLWLPMIYKPKDESPGLFQVQAGDTGDWGFYILTSKRFQITDYPESMVRLHFDWYEKRGFGYGANGEVRSEDSVFDFSAYSIYDESPYEDAGRWDVNRRFNIPASRYNFSISDLTHITPRLDFRGSFNYSSDYYFRNDFMNEAYDKNTEPITFASLEYQLDWASVAVYARPRVNNFYTTVERLPEIRIDLPRQELFGTNIYYQSETSLAYMQMKWREFDNTWYDDYLKSIGRPTARTANDYEALRFDSLHMFYYPIKIDWLNVVPRGGVRFTNYSDSSKREISEGDLMKMFLANKPYGRIPGNTPSYDNRGGNRFRVTGEIGVEASTKIYNSWQDVRSRWMRIDGLRHMLQPYVNYTYIPGVTEDPEHLYYFDDIDRITEQNFIRFGLQQRLQTRSGTWGDAQIQDWLTLENYWDLFFKENEGYNNIGDLNTLLNFTPGNGFSFSALCSFDLGDNYERNNVLRRGRNAGHPGLDWHMLNNLILTMRYEFIEDFVLSASYNFQGQYMPRSAYSMGSYLTNVAGGSAFTTNSTTRTQTAQLAYSMPLLPDRSLFGRYSINYDFDAGQITSIALQFVKNLHCWEVAFGVGVDREYKSDKGYEAKFNFGFSAALVGVVSPLNNVSRDRIKNALSTGSLRTN